MTTTNSANALNYLSNPKHRNNTPNASQWSVSVADEQVCFELSLRRLWTSGHVAWGLHLTQTHATKLGPAVLGFDVIAGSKEPVKLAKFVSDQGTYHGYPVAHWANPYDRPPESVLRSWHSQGYISKSTFSKITRRKKCDVK